MGKFCAGNSKVCGGGGGDILLIGLVLGLLRMGFEVDWEQEVTRSEVEESMWANTVCTWSDELECYLDYLSVMPMSEIKEHYVKDEVRCRSCVCLSR